MVIIKRAMSRTNHGSRQFTKYHRDLLRPLLLIHMKSPDPPLPLLHLPPFLLFADSFTFFSVSFLVKLLVTIKKRYMDSQDSTKLLVTILEFL